MADRYDDYERGRRSGERREENDRGEWGRDDPNRGHAGRGYQEESYRGEERFGRGDGDRERRPSYGGEFGNRGDYGSRGDYGNRQDWGRQDFGNRQDWGNRQYYGNRQDYGNRYESGNRGYQGEQDWRRRNQSNLEQSGSVGPWGTGSGGFGTGYRSGEFSSAGGAYGSAGDYTGYGAGGSESYGGGAGMRSQQGQQGRFSGRGPKGYQRGDDRIREDVCERLTHHPEIDASEIEVQVKEGEVTLTGSVDDRQAKRMAEDVAESVSGVKDVRNQVQVRQTQMSGAHKGGSESEKGGSEKTGSQKR